jgi:hypothetical protein
MCPEEKHFVGAGTSWFAYSVVRALQLCGYSRRSILDSLRFKVVEPNK